MVRHTCPWWLGYFLVNPLRRLIQNPEKILGPFIKDGMTAMDVGPGMGFFSIPMAKLAGENGKVICVDIQEKMLRALAKRAQKAGVANRIENRVCTPNSLCLVDLKEKIDFALAFAVIHEARDQKALFTQILQALTPSGYLLVSEPKGHVSVEKINQSIITALKCGFEEFAYPKITNCFSVLLSKKNPNFFL